MAKVYYSKPIRVEAIRLTKTLALDCFKNRKTIFGYSLQGHYSLKDREVYSAYCVVGRFAGEIYKAVLGDWIVRDYKHRKVAVHSHEVFKKNFITRNSLRNNYGRK